MSFTLYKSEALELDDNQYNIIKIFINYCIDFLKLTEDFNVYLVNGDDPDKPDMTLACFDMKTNDVWVRCNGRIVMDICRSIAHELVHLKQKIYNEIDMSDYTDIGGKIEDEANSVAGIICKSFVKKYNCKWIYNI
jgi:hypothetical protein